MGSGPEHMSHRNSPGIPLELREEHSLTRRFAHLLPARNRLGLVLLKARPEVQEDRTCFHPVDLPAQPSPPPVPPPAPPRHHQNQPQSKTRGCLQLCHLPAANPRTGALLMILTARNTTRLIFFFFFPILQGPCPPSPKLGITGTATSHLVQRFCSAQDLCSKLTRTEPGKGIGGLECLVTASQPELGVTRHLQCAQRETGQVERTGVMLPHVLQTGLPCQPKDFYLLCFWADLWQIIIAERKQTISGNGRKVRMGVKCWGAP